MNDIQHPVKNHEVDLIELFGNLWRGRKTIIKFTLVFVLIGLIITIISPKEYTTTVVFVPQVDRGQPAMGNLSGLASLAGININSGGNSHSLSPYVYSEIISSAPFHMELMNTPITIDELEQPITIFDYYTNHKKPNPILKYTLGLPGLILNSFRKKSDESIPNEQPFIQLNKNQQRVKNIMGQRISIELIEKGYYIKLSGRMPEALASAQLTEKAQKLLQQLITEFKIQKATIRLDFIQLRYNDILQQYNKAHETLARFQDQNKNVSTAMAQTELQRLTNDYNLCFDLYHEITKQLEQAKIQVKEDTPVFTIIQPTSVPSEKSKPRRALTLAVCFIVGGFVSMAYVLNKQSGRWDDIWTILRN